MGGKRRNEQRLVVQKLQAEVSVSRLHMQNGNRRRNSLGVSQKKLTKLEEQAARLREKLEGISQKRAQNAGRQAAEQKKLEQLKIQEKAEREAFATRCPDRDFRMKKIFTAPAAHRKRRNVWRPSVRHMRQNWPGQRRHRGSTRRQTAGLERRDTEKDFKAGKRDCRGTGRAEAGTAKGNLPAQCEQGGL